MSVFSTWAENGSIDTQGRGTGEAAAITGSESGLGQVLDSNGATMALFSSLVWGQAACRSAGFRSEQGMKDAKKLLDKPTNGAGPHGRQGKENVMAPACFCGLSCSSSLDSAPTPTRQDKVK